jgi:transposase
MRCLAEHRDDLVLVRTQIVNRRPDRRRRGRALRSIRPRAVLACTLRQVAVQLLSDVRRLDRRITEATATLSAAVAASGTTLTGLHGVGDVVAAKILVGGNERGQDPQRSHALPETAPC